MFKEVIFTTHARQRLTERGATEESVVEAIRTGTRESAQRGLSQHRLNIEFKREWAGKYYDVQQVSPIVDEEETRIVVVTVYVMYF